MSRNKPSSAIMRCGTEQPDQPGRVLESGPLRVEFDNGALRYIRVHGVEVLRGVAFLVRDENWGTYVPTVSNLVVKQTASGFQVSYDAVCARPGQEIAFSAHIEGDAAGNLAFRCTARPRTDFLTARTGFVVLHPLTGTAGHPLTVEHVDGRTEAAGFPAEVNPIQPHLNIRALTHEALPGLKVTVRMEGDTFEMEDHRNWTDASFKTYVRPLALPWPYTLKAGETVEQAVTVTLHGKARTRAGTAASEDVEVRLGKLETATLAPVGIGMPAEEIAPAIARLAWLRRMAPRLLVCPCDTAAPDLRARLYGYRVIAEQTGAAVVLEVVVRSVDDFRTELERTAREVRESGLRLSALVLCPEGDLKSVLPGGKRPPAAPLEALYAAGRAAFPGIRLGGGMLSFFTELNRKRPPAQLLDFVTNTTCPIVHAADDRSVMETLEALPYQVRTARGYIGQAAYRVGPSAIGCRDNPHGATFTPNPDNLRVCLARMDPRQRGLFGAAWTLGYVATLAYEGLEAITLGAPTGPLGTLYRPDEQAQPWFDEADAVVYPAYHVVSGLTRGAGQQLRSAVSSRPGAVRALAYGSRRGTTVWLANLTAHRQVVSLRGLNAGAAFIGCLDESSFVTATTDPLRFQRSWKAADPGRIVLAPYAVAFLSLDARPA